MTAASIILLLKRFLEETLGTIPVLTCVRNLLPFKQ